MKNIYNLAARLKTAFMSALRKEDRKIPAENVRGGVETPLVIDWDALKKGSVSSDGVYETAIGSIIAATSILKAGKP